MFMMKSLITSTKNVIEQNLYTVQENPLLINNQVSLQKGISTGTRARQQRAAKKAKPLEFSSKTLKAILISNLLEWKRQQSSQIQLRPKIGWLIFSFSCTNERQAYWSFGILWLFQLMAASCQSPQCILQHVLVNPYWTSFLSYNISSKK